MYKNMLSRPTQLHRSTILGIILVVVWLIPKPWKDIAGDHGRSDDPGNAGSRLHFPSWVPIVGSPSDDMSNNNGSKANTISDDEAATGGSWIHLPSWRQPEQPSTSSRDTVVLYSYYETENAFKNAAFFIRHGLHDSAHFIFILMGESPLLDTVLPTAANIETYRRNNTCYDLGAYGEVIQEKGLLTSLYSKFIMLNASIRGPFLPTWSTDCWSTTWLSKISTNVKLQGMSTNCYPNFHIQSMIMGTDKEGLQILVDDGTLHCADGWEQAVGQEITTATTIMSHGWQVNAWLTALHGDKSYEDRLNCADVGNRDHLFEGRYFGFDVHPYETIFVKANRDINPVMLAKMTEWHDHMNYSSYDYC